MLNLDEINKEILMLETTRDTTYATIEKLAPLYIVRNNLTKKDTEPSGVLATISSDRETPFWAAASGKDFSKVLDVVDELVSTLQLTNPPLFNAVIHHLNDV